MKVYSIMDFFELKSISLQEAMLKHGLSEYINVQKLLGKKVPAKRILICDENLFCDMDFNTDYKDGFENIWNKFYGLIVTGNFYINGDLINHASDKSFFLLTEGHLHAHNAYFGMGRFFIEGKLLVRYLILENGNDGLVNISGETIAKLILLINT
ncbi:hypothetical protein [Marinicella sp. W31]|uniref:hypothetical protein n=1 Tax=Marinicella sp. W31 TaxID=3023713 RepID=UPI0037577E12